MGKMTKMAKLNKCKKNKKYNHPKHVFLMVLEAQGNRKPIETIIKKGMQKMVDFENKNISFMDKIHLEKVGRNVKIGKMCFFRFADCFTRTLWCH